jgi:hypothetical protein
MEIKSSESQRIPDKMLWGSARYQDWLGLAEQPELGGENSLQRIN